MRRNSMNKLFVLLFCGVICESFCNTLSEKNLKNLEAKVADQGAKYDKQLSMLHAQFEEMKSDIQSLNEAVTKLLLRESQDLEEAHDVKKRAVVSVGDGLSGLPDVQLQNIQESGGAVYTRWGRTECGDDSELLYSGYAGGSHYSNAGGGVNYQCMPLDPQFNLVNPGTWYGSWMAGVEYETPKTGIFPDSSFQQNAPCARCYTKNRSAVMMIPAKRDCSEGWTKEYEGYLMTELHNHNHQSTFECVDQSPEYINGEGADANGGLFYFVRTYCPSGGHCPPYDQKKELTCVVCSK